VLQRRMAKGVKVVAEGRDMGTVVFSEAGNKFFLTASAEIRSKRRFDERISRGESVSLNGVTKELKKRDHRDQTRTVAPLKPAEDAKVIDSTALTPDEVVQKILDSLDYKTE
jgi:CMP/dCMP kinase